MNKNDDQPVTVFISYSHDTPEHKRWVAKFAARLLENGIQVNLDQWDLKYGDDLPKYMERSVTQSDRVLMICTEAYVNKANDGKGGVGYEAMIVTGQLVSDLGTSKFIPIIRQSSNPAITPTSVGTRLYIDLSNDSEENMMELIREIHKVPSIKKPPLGKNPFAKTPLGTEAIIIVTEHEPQLSIGVTSPIDSYNSAKSIVLSEDILKWRELIRNARNSMASELKIWRAKYENINIGNNVDELIEQSLEGITAFTPLIAIALAGVGSGKDSFSSQSALLDEILNPIDWNRSGFVRIISITYSAAFIYQGIHGAMCVYTNQCAVALNLVNRSVSIADWTKPTQISKVNEIMGWPQSLSGNSEKAWAVLFTLPNKYQWIKSIFGDDLDYQTSLVAYYMALNINEFSEKLALDPTASFIKNDIHRINIPLFFETAGTEVKRRAYNLLIQDPEQIKLIWQSRGLPDSIVKVYWQDWVQICYKWLKSGGKYFSFSELTHANLMEDLGIN